MQQTAGLTYAPYAGAIGLRLMDTSVIELIIARLPESLLVVEHRAGRGQIKAEQAQILLQAAERALLRSQRCLAQHREPPSADQSGTTGAKNLPR